ncbi:acetyl-CoA carboxylase biotin carboxyl carrier protein subunit [Siccirubricoccus sp. G192]|uniref:acetyl-CoA carboxylase biotin carboxyl carrier protein subunit n=1 Tax=Siccirubricoccus sp. G192 TaxID=2849651 RepID=UPI001C2BB93A|nr:acetyl-CoA carboxylase biotin carboxyl carrier protein subunit [Siccirubricoccus sp. G192]MBV1795721.1 acetyl-CoA carboxylase biotin carboxyl carrier protein subunit [Siccirubricoccus sp. G192]
MARIPVKSELSGSVWKLQVQIGDQVEEGTDLLLLESMKMEIPVSAPSLGVVAEILVTESEPVTEGQVLVILTR